MKISQNKNDFKHNPGTIDQVFAPEYFHIIFRYLLNNKDLHSCLLVNKYWASCAVPILWESPFKINDKFIPSPKLIRTYLTFIVVENFHNCSTVKRPLYDYPSFLKELPFDRFLNAAIANGYPEAKNH
ncbi:13630_t:CDS:1 [Dentiscutata erythropus]|uniref:13630_t:CDS:1 n=1 Tax=Dentiscutata erythropus TaxID=1348616 RepID=A0A9N8ZS30_9GLOM|nr:13630_t:CDS:1 [Dentiscutata erythropus]